MELFDKKDVVSEWVGGVLFTLVYRRGVDACDRWLRVMNTEHGIHAGVWVYLSLCYLNSDFSLVHERTEVVKAWKVTMLKMTYLCLSIPSQWDLEPRLPHLLPHVSSHTVQPHTCSMRFHCYSYLLSEQLPTLPPRKPHKHTYFPSMLLPYVSPVIKGVILLYTFEALQSGTRVFIPGVF